ncbi:MAG: RecX family transcriptional regulator [Acidobacteria bacterium]|nr:RecX family transcriptional regulator [Acidobacteriota bacterium]
MGFRPRRLESEDELYDCAVAILARRMRTIAELKRLLGGRVDSTTEIGEALVALVIRRLKDQGYVDDAKYAAAYSSFRRDNEKFGRRRVAADLKTKGVHREIIDKTLDSAFHEVDEEKQARAFLRRKRVKKPRNQVEAARISRQLVRAGFGGQTIFRVLGKWGIEITEMAEEETFEERGGNLED